MTVSGYAKEGVLVSPEWARAHLDDPNVRFVEVDVDTAAYEQAHLPGAVGWDWTSQLSDGIRRDIASRDDLQSLLRASGIDRDTHIVLYGLRAFRDDILRRLGDPGLALVDVRSPAEFSGEVIAPAGMAETAQRAGHIPGAASIPWARTVREDGTFRSADELRALYEGEGVTPDKEVIAYCRIGERSSHSWFVLRELLGYPRVRNYDGSWTEWGSMVNVPIER
jgi:thiosulfate/3-mercaptopyruvate sulfurtransferase